VTTIGNLLTAANLGRVFRGQAEAIKQWFTIDRTAGPGHGFQYQFWTDFFPCSIRRI
jgi:hypothetical protein